MSVSITTLSAFVFISCLTMATDSASGESPEQVQGLRNWVADIVRGDEFERKPARPSHQSPSDSIPVRIQVNSRGLMADVMEILNTRIGWLIPRTVKERALLWLMLSATFPWAFTGTLQAILKNDLFALRLLIVAIWSTLAVWLGWKLWGQASGPDRFASTMLILVPVLFSYFGSVVKGLSPGHPAT